MNRPEYTPAPETLLTALSWNAFSLEPTTYRGLLFKYKRASPRRDGFFETYPRDSDPRLQEFEDALVAHGVTTEDHNRVMTRALIDSLIGAEVKKSPTQAVSPLSPSIAALQNLVGMTGHASPAAVDKILEHFYSLGAGFDASSSATQLWLEACKHRLKNDHLLKALNDCAAVLLPGTLVEKDTTTIRTRQQASTGDLTNTPFSWFSRSWENITSPEWVDALPARVWTDWATTVLRLGIGVGFLWEAAWFQNLAREVLDVDGKARTWEQLKSGVGSIIPWEPSNAAVSIRDVTPTLKTRVFRAHCVREVLVYWLNADALRATSPLTEAVDEMRRDSELISALSAALNYRSEPNTNIWETVSFTLQTRDSDSGTPDYYGLLRRHGRRYLLVDPASEWISIIASLSSSGPGEKTTVGAISKNLSELGLRPSFNELICLLERAGLARGSADADQAVLVESAF